MSLVLAPLVDSLERFPATLRGALAGPTDDELARAPSGGGWSLRDVVIHLVEEERRDFRPRVERTLADPIVPWDPIDPESTVAERSATGVDVAALLDEFERERAGSVAWLRELDAPDFERVYTGNDWGIRAGDVMLSWAAHDHMHLRQIERLRVELLRTQGGPFSTEYAG